MQRLRRGPASLDAANEAPARTSVAAPETTAPGQSVQLRVVRGDGEAVPGAIVHYGDWGQLGARFAALPAERQAALRYAAEATLVELGARVVADDAGIARWPLVADERSHWHAVARDGVLFGETWISKTAPAEEVHTVRLALDVTAHVRVVDARGAPVAGIPIVATFDGNGEHARRERQRLGTSDHAGDVVLHHVQTWRERIAPRGSALPAALDFDLPGVPAAHEIDAAPPPAEPIVLRLPPTGWIDVIAIDSYGVPRRGESFAVQRDAASRRERATTDDGGAVCFRVGLAQSFVVGPARAPIEQWRSVAGPRVADERVVVRFEPRPAPMLTGRILRDGHPVADAQVVATIEDDPAGIGSPRTDDRGRFRIALVSKWLDRTVGEIRIGAAGDPRIPADTGTWRGNVRLVAGEHDLGDVVVMPLPVIVSGTVTGTNDAPPPPEARVAIQNRIAGESAWRWAQVAMRQVPDGAFLASGDVPDGELRLIVHGPGFVPPAPLPFVAGARDLRIELQRGGSVRVSVKVGSQIAAAGIEPLLLPHDGVRADDVLMPFTPQLDPRVPAEWSFVRDEPLTMAFTWPAVRAGRYRLEVRARCVPRPIAVIDDVIVIDGERTDDARLVDVDCMGLRSVQLQLPGVMQHAVDMRRGAGVVAVLEGDVPGDRLFQIDGEMVFFSAANPLDVFVRVDGCCDVVLRGVIGETNVALEPGIAVEVIAEREPNAAVVPCVFSLTALDDPLAAARPTVWSPAAGGSTGRIWYDSPTLTARGKEGDAPIRVPRAGRYRVAAGAATVCEPEVIDVPAAGGRFTVRVR